MWVFTKHGFFSVVEKWDNKSLVMVRSREKDHLHALKAAIGIKATLRRSTATDYPYRITISKSLWAHTLSQLAEDINYPNFKDEAEMVERGRKKSNRTPYSDNLHDIWRILKGAFVTK
jgi:hypothetical protein